MKLRKIISLAVNLLAIIFSMIGFLLIARDTAAIAYVKYFTLVTNLLIVVVGTISVGYSVEFLIHKDKVILHPAYLFILKLITSVGSLITFLTVVCFLQHTEYAKPDVSAVMHANNVMHHYLAPLTFTLGFILLDLDKKYNWKIFFTGISVLVIYMIYAIPISNIPACASWWTTGGKQAPYIFMDINVVKQWMFALIPGFLIGGLGISFLVWLLNRISYLLFVGDEIKEDAEETAEEKAIEAKVQVTEADEAAVGEILKKSKAGPRIYHISRREDKMWQVKFANGKRALKLFNTQAEAIVFAKKLAKSQLGSIRIHSLKGRIRKSV